MDVALCTYPHPLHSPEYCMIVVIALLWIFPGCSDDPDALQIRPLIVPAECSGVCVAVVEVVLVVHRTHDAGYVLVNCLGLP